MARHSFYFRGDRNERILLDLGELYEKNDTPSDRPRSYIPIAGTLAFSHVTPEGGRLVERPISLLEAEALWPRTLYFIETDITIEQFLGLRGELAKTAYRTLLNAETGIDEGEDADAAELMADIPEEDLEENYRQGVEGHRGP